MIPVQAPMRKKSTRSSAPLPSFSLTRPMARVAKQNPDWSKERLEAAESSYRDFLRECKVTHVGLSPKGDVDEVWHAHILHTRQYAENCETYCGRFIHHNPIDNLGDCDGDGGDTCRPCESDPNEVQQH